MKGSTVTTMVLLGIGGFSFMVYVVLPYGGRNGEPEHNRAVAGVTIACWATVCQTVGRYEGFREIIGGYGGVGAAAFTSISGHNRPRPTTINGFDSPWGHHYSRLLLGNFGTSLLQGSHRTIYDSVTCSGW